MTEKKEEPDFENAENREQETPSVVDSNLEYSITQNPTQEAGNMEVHHHAHHGHEKKTWKNYFWEFFMLFLAVFCGFLAELQLEHYIEHQREKKYMTRIYNDLKKDTSFYRNHAIYQSSLYYLLDSTIQYLHSERYKQEPDLFYNMLLRVRTTRYLEYHNTAFDQMKTSGNLRLIQDEKILDSLLNYYYVIEKRALVADNRYLESVTESNKALVLFWDGGNFIGDSLQSFRPISLMYKTSNASFPDVPMIHRLQLKNVLFQRKLQLVPLRNFTLNLNLQASRLLKQIEKEYHLEKHS